jgi:serine phosphatase RsbU (regulator of sigma subunit)
VPDDNADELTRDDRDHRADRADRLAARRDVAADARDREADDRERGAHADSLHRSQRGGPPSDRQAAAGDRRAGADDRTRARVDRLQAAGDRQYAAERAREQEVTREVFDEFQRMLLPTPAPGVPVVTMHRPGDDRLLLGGDFLDAVRLLDGSLRFIVGDVSGHGPTPAGVAVALRLAWRTLALAGTGVAETLTQMEATLLSHPGVGELFATAWCGAMDGDDLCFASAGHPPPIMLERPSYEAALDVAPPLGMANGGPFPVTNLTLPPGGVLVYTDGLTEGRLAAGLPPRLGVEGLIRVIEEVDLPRHPTQLGLLVELISDRAGGLSDDAAALLIHPTRGRTPRV